MWLYMEPKAGETKSCLISSFAYTVFFLKMAKEELGHLLPVFPAEAFPDQCHSHALTYLPLLTSALG